MKNLALFSPHIGLSPLAGTEFIFSALDGTLQRFTLPDIGSHDWSGDSHVTSEVFSIETTTPGQSYSVQGVALSHHGVFAAVAVK